MAFRSLSIEEVVIAPRSPWQNPFAERVIGSIRRECLDQIIALNEQHLRRILRRYFAYYLRWRTHLSASRMIAQDTRRADRGHVWRRPLMDAPLEPSVQRVAATTWAGLEVRGIGRLEPGRGFSGRTG